MNTTQQCGIHVNTNFANLPDTRGVDAENEARDFYMTVRECLDSLYTEDQRRRIDTAIPQPWADAVLAETGIYPPGLIVWSYNKEHGSDLMGAPVPTCGEGLSLLLRLR